MIHSLYVDKTQLPIAEQVLQIEAQQASTENSQAS